MDPGPLVIAARTALTALRPRPGELWLVACSGGPDSLALLSVAAGLREELGVRLGAVYVDHGLRPAAAAEGDFVRAAAADLDVAAEVRRVDAGARAAREHRSLMEAARLERYAALEAAADAAGARWVLLGHTADDQVETVLMRLLRGTGLRGLAGIPDRRDRYVRPLLDVSRAAVESYLRQHGLTPVRDPSNDDRRFLRPLVRHDLLPTLRRQLPDIDRQLLALSARARAATRLLDQALDVEEADGRAVLSVPALRAAPQRLRRGRLERAYRRAGGGGLCAAHLAAIERLLECTAGTRGVDLPGAIRAERRYDTVCFVRREHAAAAAPAAVPIPGPGRYELLGRRFVIEDCDPSEAAAPAARGVAYFDPDALVFPLVLRPPRPGDRIRPRGFGRRRKLFDVLGEARLPAPTRRGMPVLADQGEVLFVPGLRPSERGRPRPTSCRTLRVAVTLLEVARAV